MRHFLAVQENYYHARDEFMSQGVLLHSILFFFIIYLVSIVMVPEIHMIYFPQLFIEHNVLLDIHCHRFSVSMSSYFYLTYTCHF